jgi:hypothetical protein
MVLIPSICKRFSYVSQANKPQQTHQYLRVYTTYTQAHNQHLKTNTQTRTSTENTDTMILGGRQIYLAPKSNMSVIALRHEIVHDLRNMALHLFKCTN